MARSGITDQLLVVGREVALDDGSAVRCTRVDQRIWSRVGTGEARSGELLFLKQHVDIGGVRQPNLWAFEQEGHGLAGQMLSTIVRIPRLQGANSEALVNAFENVEMQPMDALLRTNARAFFVAFPDVLARMRAVLDVMAAEVDGNFGLQLPKKSSPPYASRGNAINFKGFDFRNVAVTTTSEISLFDFGRPYVAPIEEAGAKLLISIGMLNWGRPLRRFARGIPIMLLEQAADVLDPFLSQPAALAEIDLQRSFRIREVRGRGVIERTAKLLGVSVLGRRYLRALKDWCSANLA